MLYSSWTQQIAFRLPPYDTPHAASCNKAEFHIHCRHAAVGVCEQRMTAVQNYMWRDTVYVHIFAGWIFHEWPISEDFIVEKPSFT